jgi:hypothetical protein
MSSMTKSLSARGCADREVPNDSSSCRKPQAQGSATTSLRAIVRDYLVVYQPIHEQELTWFRNQSSFEGALRLASHAEDERGRRYSHQRRIKSRAIIEAFRVLADSHDDLEQCSSFHQLWELVGSRLAPIEGVAELYIYDTALRLGAYLRLKPERVYLHAGTRIGAKGLGLLSPSDMHRLWLEPVELPSVLGKLPPLDVENLLCIYKEKLAQLRRPN